MKKLIATVAASVLGAVCFAELTVVTTTEDLESIAEAIGGDEVKVSAIVKGARNAHLIDAKPSYMSRLRNADLFIAVGLDLEIAWEGAIIRGSRNGNIKPGSSGHLYASAGIAVLQKPTGRVTRAQGDVHPNGNPHIWLDPYNARIIASSIADKMTELDPASEATYSKNLTRFQKKIDEKMFGRTLVASVGAGKLWSWSNAGKLEAELKSSGNLSKLSGWAGKMAPHRGKSIVTYHKSWPYFAARFGLKVVAQLEPKPGIPPTPGHVASVIRTVKSKKVKLILQPPFYSKRAGTTVAARTGAKLVIAPLTVGSESSIKDYFDLIDAIVARTSRALGG